MVPCSVLTLFPPGWESGLAPPWSSLPWLPIPAREGVSQPRREREVHEKLTSSLLTWGVARTERPTQFPAKFYFWYFSTEMTADRSTWETSCICPPFTETGVTRAERAPVSDTMSQGGVNSRRPLAVHSVNRAEETIPLPSWSLLSSLGGNIDLIK